MIRTIPASFIPLAVCASALALAGCNAASTTRARAPAAPAETVASVAPAAPSGVTPASFRLPEGSGCTAEIARWKAIQDNDLAAGHVSKTVHDRIAVDIAQASAACQAGRDAEARGLVRASRVRNGYPAS